MRSPHEWRPLAAYNVAGRATCVVIDPRNPQRALAGSAAGGLWMTENGGESWWPQSDGLPSLSVGAVALDPANPDVVYLGTGEASGANDSVRGCGIYRREGAGEWACIGSTADEPGLPYRVGALAVDPFDAGHVMAGSSSMADDEVAGVHHGRRQADGRWAWTLVSGFAFQDGTREDDGAAPESGPYACHSIVFHPAHKGVVYAAVNLRGWRSGIYRWDDADPSWRQLEKGLPAGDQIGRMSIAMGRIGESWVMWALVGHPDGHVIGVFRSDDEGESWYETSGRHFAQEKIAGGLAVYGDDAAAVLCGGRDVHASLDGGVTWQQVTEHDAPVDDPQSAGAEHHGLAAARGGDRYWAYSANGGGVSVSRTTGETWWNDGLGMMSSMVLRVDVAGSDASTVIAGLRNGGTVTRPAGESSFRRELRGGGCVLFDPDDAAWMVASAPGGELFRHTSASGWQKITPPDSDASDVRLPVVIMDRRKGRKTPRPLLFGTKRIWKSWNGGETWRAVSGVLDGSAVTALHLPRDGVRVAFAGTKDGGFFLSLDGGNTWGENLAGYDLPDATIASIAARPGETMHVLAAVGTGLFLTLDGGARWQRADIANVLPAAAHHCVVFDDRGTAYAATDRGVYAGAWVEEKSGYEWRDISGDLPQVMVTDLVYHAASNTLTAATYGRGIFRLAL